MGNSHATASDFSSLPNFSFLQEARSIFVSPMPSSIPAPTEATTVKLPFETELRDLPSALSGAKTPHIPGLPADLGAPQIPGVSLREFDQNRFGSFRFLEEAKSLDGVQSQKSLAQIPSELGSSSFSDLSSAPFDVTAIRRDFPILQEKINGRQHQSPKSRRPNSVDAHDRRKGDEFPECP